MQQVFRGSMESTSDEGPTSTSLLIPLLCEMLSYALNVNTAKRLNNERRLVPSPGQVGPALVQNLLCVCGCLPGIQDGTTWWSGR